MRGDNAGGSDFSECGLVMSRVAEMSAICMTPDELLALPNEKDFELVDGELVKRSGEFEVSHVAGQLAGRLFLFNQTRGLGWVQGAGCGYTLPLLGGLTVRKPRVSFVSFHRLPPTGTIPQGYPEVAPELAAEVVAPSDFACDVESKIDDYLRAGVRLIWIINPAGRSVQIYRQDGSTARLLESDDLDGEDVLPGFSCKIAGLFTVPQPAA